jgi:hypothetical protein
MENSLNFLSTRSGFNTALKHFKLAAGFINRIGQGNNLAELINEAIDQNIVSQYQFPPLLNAILVEKLGYYSGSFNLKKPNPEPAQITDKMGSLKQFDFVVVYYHPQLGQLLINPKNKANWDVISGGLKENELIVIYTGNYGNDLNQGIAEKATQALMELIGGKGIKFTGKSTAKSPAKITSVPKTEVIQKPSKFEAAEEAPVERSYEQENTPTVVADQPVSSEKKKLSPSYGIVVTNELFHNGNVEAWKRIIDSYHTKYSYMKVLVFYESEQIHDINTLFKWGKVKHGTMIEFRLLGPEFKDVSKLRRYLAQGASPRFVDFLKGAVGQILPLF